MRCRKYKSLRSARPRGQRLAAAMKPRSEEGTMKLLGLLFLIIGLIGCKDSSTNLGNIPLPSFTSRVSSCSRMDAPLGGALDSVFTYSFHQNLEMSFSIIADCCSDSNRFVVSYSLSADTIIISITNTAIISCNCICRRLIQAEIMNLPGNHYIIRCQLGQGSGIGNPIHLITVHRAPG